MLGEFLDAHPVDLVVTQGMLLPATVAVATRRGLPSAAFVRAYRAFCPTQFQDRDPLRECTGRCLGCLPRRRRFFTRALRATMDQQERGLRDASVVFVNSRYVQQVVRKFTEIEAEVVYPTVDLARYANSDSDADSVGDAVLFVKPQRLKGISIFLDLARRLPDTRFLVAPKSGDKIDENGIAKKPGIAGEIITPPKILVASRS